MSNQQSNSPPNLAESADRGPLVSILIAAYNAEKFLSETLSCVRAQSYTRLQILVVDDGSTDGTRALIEEHAKDDPRVRLLTQVNSGLSAARNHALREAQGEYLAILDADDLFHSRKIELQVMALHGQKRAYCLTGVLRFMDTEAGREWLSATAPPEVAEDYRDRLLFTDNGAMVVFNSALLPTAVVRGVGGWNTQIKTAEDWDLWLRVARELQPINLSASLHWYRKHKASITATARMDKTLAYQLKILENQRGFGGPPDSLVRKAMAYKLLWYAKFLRQKGLKGQMLGPLLRACRLSPVSTFGALMRHGC